VTVALGPGVSVVKLMRSHPSGREKVVGVRRA
jgi:hypothetical protein